MTDELEQAIQKRKEQIATGQRISSEDKAILLEEEKFFANLLEIEGQKLLQNPQIKPFIELLDEAVSKIPVTVLTTGPTKINKIISFKWGRLDDPKGEDSKEYQFSTELGAENPNFKMISYLIKKGESKLPIIIKIRYESENKQDNVNFICRIGLRDIPTELFVPVFEKGIYEYKISRCRHWSYTDSSFLIHEGILNKPESLQKAIDSFAVLINDKQYKAED